MLKRCREFVDSRLRRSPPDRASAVLCGQAGENALRFPRLAHRSAAAHKLHSTPQQDRINLISGKGETSSRHRPLAYSSPKAVQTPGTVAGCAGITKALDSGAWPKRTVMLKEQSRMHDQIWQMISGPMYRNQLRTIDYKPAENIPPAPFETTLTIIDTSTIIPFVNRDPIGSRYNLMHGLAVRNLVHHFQHDGYLTSDKRLGVCSPFAAQAKLLKRLLADLRLRVRVEAGTVHRYQGNEKEVVVIDIPDGVGEPRRAGRLAGSRRRH